MRYDLLDYQREAAIEVVRRLDWGRNDSLFGLAAGLSCGVMTLLHAADGDRYVPATMT